MLVFFIFYDEEAVEHLSPYGPVVALLVAALMLLIMFSNLPVESYYVVYCVVSPLVDLLSAISAYFSFVR